MQPGALEEALSNGARAVIITPRAHNPTGCSLSESRARAIREILARYPQVLVIVDDHFALLSATPRTPYRRGKSALGAGTLPVKNPGTRFASGHRRQRR